ncbi:cupin domain-containing protein [Mycobacterium sp. CBMA247]|nr:cupin domain-containing protein [Mycolicibacterium sp. CBMA 329]MUL86229.1 cupin domain-containing protein [Mycolicibacterium sp. CBMA 331]MUM01109.1 cupin domain-containing protein [Mycolicibacterium sp. CBMA 334]MUM25002.1 cupin domain-containing protein [Mycolicibacterium sp. CBMA 295]MUM36525.1 cupin domain-containing protein [Mycolicibacterium sp. CBMA 247]MUM42293.1 cupin domain-containing protein [Mycolicibacterium sp. CBMA 294]
MTALGSNCSITAPTIALELTDVRTDQLIAGRPQTGTAELGTIGDVEIGVWEMTEGTMRDVEAEEVFVVLTGRAVVEFDDGTAPLHLQSGDVARLAAGARTVWTVTERLRKVYITA